ncbi:MAG TPA: hypothetical protein VJT72_01035, partial [Pseudonocardiaceae bacterium]|nr:hypothetical protein [Pseudonocardiaceae bacterium]
LVVTRRDGDIELDPHATGACVVRLDESGARDLCETLMEWLGLRSWTAPELRSLAKELTAAVRATEQEMRSLLPQTYSKIMQPVSGQRWTGLISSSKSAARKVTMK